MIFSRNVQGRRSKAALAFSAVMHAGLLTLLLLAARNHVRPVYRESRCCTAALYWNGTSGAGHAQAHVKLRAKSAPKHRETPAHRAAVLPAPVKTAAASQPQTGLGAQQQSSPGIGNDTADAEPALPVYFPRPQVEDRSLLPAAEQNVVVHVSISETGAVTDEKLVRGLGNPLDQLVLDTVKTWRFHPATLNGTAIASTEELVFPFSQHSPSAAGV